MKPVDDWGSFAGTWGSGETDAPLPSLEALRSRDRLVRRRSRWIRIGAAILGILIAIQGVRILRYHPTLGGLALVVPGWITSALLVRLAVLRTRRLEPRDESSVAWLGAMARALEAELRTTSALLALVAVQAVVVATWAAARFIERSGRPTPPDLARWGIAGGAAAVLLIWALNRRRGLRRETEAVRRLRSEYDESG